MIGLALVTFVSIFAAGFRASVDDVVDKQFAGDLTVRNKDGFSPIPLGTRPALAEVRAVGSVTGVRFGISLVGGKETPTIGVDPANLSDGYRLTWRQGDDAVMRGLGAGETVVDGTWADDNGVRVGETVSAVTTKGERRPLKVVGSLDEAGRGLLGGGMIVGQRPSSSATGTDAATRSCSSPFADGVRRRRAPPASTASSTTSFPIAESQDREEVKEAQAGPDQHDPHPFYAQLACR
jgi:hypothetical protein